jgi:predicted DNA-binding transcriptional regulator AlpA
MKIISTRQAAKRLGLLTGTLARYVAVGKLPTPRKVEMGGATVFSWTEEEIERARVLLPKIGNGRKTRWQRQREKQKIPARAPVPHKQRKTKATKKK